MSHQLRSAIVIYVFLTVVVISSIAFSWQEVSKPVSQSAAQAPNRSIRQIKALLDPNTAEWAELANLPGIGETIAKRIVHYRKERAASTGNDEPVFQKLEDLDPIRGIGPKRLEQLSDYLHFPSNVSP